MAELGRRGLRIDDSDEPAKNYEKQSLDANRKRSNFEKDMDDLLFGGGMRPVRRPAREEPKPNQSAKIPATQTNKVSEPVKPVQPVSPRKQTTSNSQPKKVPEPVRPVQPVSPKRQIIGASKPKVEQRAPEKHQPKSPQRPQKTENKPAIGGSSPNINTVKSIGLVSRIDRMDSKVDNKQPEPETPPQSIIIEEVQIKQPKHHEQPKIKDDETVEVLRVSFNRPGYLRKGKKVAEEFNFANENSTQHSAVDVVRPFECDRDRVKRLSEPNFYDYEFPPTSYSLGYSLKNTPTEWKRHNETVKTSIFGKYIDPNDINPGKFSSDQFLSTLSVLAENEANIKRLIEDQKANSNGFYYVRLNINGVWRYVSVDNKIPYSDGEALGAQSFNDTESELWAALIQKAYAKVYSGYDVFTRPTPRENFLRDLTGAPIRKYLVTDSELPSIIRNAIVAGQPILAVPKPEILSLGLNPNNSLAVISCKSTGGLELRNAWGTLEQRSKLAFSKEGVFELSSNQTKEFISHIIIAQTNNSYCSSTIESKHRTGFYSTFSLKVNKDTNGFLSISQWDQRLFPRKSYEYSPIRLIVQKNNEDGSATYVNGGFSTSRNLDVEVNLTAGEYTVFVAGHWKSREYDYDLTFFGQHSVQFRREYTSRFPNKITEALTKLNMLTGRLEVGSVCSQHVQHHKETNLVLVTVENESQKVQLYTQDFSKVNWESLILLNAKNNEETYENLTAEQVEGLKHDANVNRKWVISVNPHEAFTWIISTGEEYNAENFRKWGFK